MADLVGLKTRLVSSWSAPTYTDFKAMRDYLTVTGRYNDNVKMPVYTDLSATYTWAFTYTIACDCVCACSK